MAAVKSLCTRGIVLENGTSVFEGTAEESVDYYLTSGKEGNKEALKHRTDRSGNGKMKLIKVDFLNENKVEVDQIISGEYLQIRLTFEKKPTLTDYRGFFIGINFKDDQEQTLLSYLSDEMGSDFSDLEAKNQITLEIPNLYIRAGVYDLRVQTGIGTRREDHFDTIENSVSIQVLPGKIWKKGSLNRPGNFAVLPGEFKL
jgi:lipopolysaccharide transport system ATP-binding protein